MKKMINFVVQIAKDGLLAKRELNTPSALLLFSILYCSEMAEVFSGIYKIQSKVKPERIYIGSTVNFDKRKKEHLNSLRRGIHHSPKLQRHYNKYGENDLVFTKIISCDPDNLIETEQYYLDIYEHYFNCYEKAGEPNRKSQSEEVKLKHSERVKKYIEEHPEELERLRKARDKYFSNPENREKLSQTMKKYFADHPEAVLKTTNICKERKQSEEEKRKRTDSLLKTIHAPGYVNPRKGMKPTAETLAKKLESFHRTTKAPGYVNPRTGTKVPIDTIIRRSIIYVTNKIIKKMDEGLAISDIGIITINYNRPKILKLFCTSINRLRKDTNMFIPCICVSDKSDEKMCVKYNINHISQDNKPVSFKWNTAVKSMMNTNIKYIMIVGSDDLISTDLFLSIHKKCEENISLIGINNCYFYGTTQPHKGKLYHFRATTMMGICKTIRMDIIKAVGGNVCPVAKGWGIDAIISKAIRPHITTSAIVDGFVCDVKSDTNLNKISLFASKVKEPTPAKVFYDTLSDEELEILKTI